MTQLHPSITTSVDNSNANIVNAQRTVTYGIVAPCANTLTVGTEYEINSLSEAITLLGVDISKGNIALKMMKILFEAQSANKIYYVYPGTNADSATTTDLDETTGILAGTTEFDLTNATGIVAGNLITIGTGTTQEVRRVLNVSGNTIKTNPLDFDHADAEAVVLITEVADSAYTTCRTTLLPRDFDIYLEDRTSATALAAAKTFLNTRVDNELLSVSYFGVAYGTSPSTAKTNATTVNEKYIRMVYPVYKDENDEIIYEGAVNATRHAAEFAVHMSKFRLANNIVVSTVYLPIRNVSEAISPDIDTALTITVVNDLINNYVGAGFQKTIGGLNKIRIIKDVSTWNEDENGLPSTLYTNIVDVEADIKIREDLPDVIERAIAVRNDVGNTLTTKEADLKDLENICLNKMLSYPFLDPAVKTTVSVTSVTPGEALVTIVYKVVESMDIIEIVLAKQIR